MDDLCNLLENLTPLHDPQQAYDELKFSSSMTLEELSNSPFLQQSFNRYKKYEKYINFKNTHIQPLILDFIYSKNKVSNFVLALKCKNIDLEILYALENCSFV